ncbi:Pls/PosA family non-ribosomal peptide synthetase [Geodermatophilus chilensis]|uniref:Pls/PosA family non-ribosomal peptide synthetase n=1 Tax=Geodermatophilus chilensis TaxID=2035835 RepID=UPI001E372E45|nr:Pls/PosA family non-ribosomal peptide synthetase [Geodermatophilus chilensis]
MLGRPVDVVSAGAVAPAPMADPVVTGYAAVLAEVLGVDSVAPDAHVFDDLGADSMVMARFCARVRKHPDLPAVSIKDVYQHPTISSLATALAPAPAADPVVTGYAAVLAEVLGVESVDPGAHVFDELGADSMVMARFCARIRRQPELPPVSIKDVYQHPTLTSLAGALAPAPTPSPVQDGLAAVLAEVLHVDTVAHDSHFFDDLGADSMVLARFCARVRKHPDLPTVAMRDVYAHPTVRRLAAAVAEVAPHPVEPSVPAPAPVGPPASRLEYVLCGALQFLVFVGYTFLYSVIFIQGYDWIFAASGAVDSYLRAVVFGGVSFVALSLLPIAAKWLLVGRWKPQEIRIWSLAYVRFWVVKTMIRTNPLALFVGTPLYALYLRALGARIGKGVAIFTRGVPVCTDLLTVGDGTVIRKDSFVNCYRAMAGMIQTGPVTLGKDVVVGETAVLEIDTSMGDGAQLGHRSTLHRGHSVPAGECWHGSPAQRADADYSAVEPLPSSTWRRVTYTVSQLANLVAFRLPLGMVVLGVLLTAVPQLDALLEPGPLAFTSWAFYGDALLFSTVIFFGYLVVSYLSILTVPRVLNLALKPGKVYPLYGFHYAIHRSITRRSNSKFLMTLFGDSSYVVHYLRSIGYRFPDLVQSGSNFGTGVKHENPYVITVGSGAMIADGIAIYNADYSSTSFRVAPVSIPGRTFMGNGIAYPSQARLGDNVLLGSVVQIPTHGEVRKDVGLLGSPAFEIPRSVERDAGVHHYSDEAERRSHLAAKNRYNLRTIGLFLLLRWLNVFGATLLVLTGADFYDRWGPWALTATMVLTLWFTIGYFMLLERAVMRFRPLTPRFCSIYDPYFWWHERYWKFLASPNPLTGTPFKGLFWRALGVRTGRMLFDDGCGIPERTLVTIGDYCTLNVGTAIQGHSQEDGAFKSDRITIGSGCTIGIDALVHYGVTMGDGVVLGPSSFLMKGEEVPPGASWGGNPARELSVPAALPALRPDDDPHPLEELMATFGEDDDPHPLEELMATFGEDDPLAAIPVPRRTGRHRAHGRHLAGSR